MINCKHHRISKPIIGIILGIDLFGIGLVLLHLNPYWRIEPGSGGYFDHHVGLWSRVGHLITALGLLCVFATTAITLLSWASRYFKTKWLYWSGVLAGFCVLAGWVVLTGTSARYIARFHWESRGGVTDFGVVAEHNVVTGMTRETPNLLWQTIVRWQIEPDLNGYLGTGQKLLRTDGDITVTVVKVVPIAVPTALGSDGETLRSTEFNHR